MKLLDSTKPAELPTEALLARLRSRRAEIDLLGPVVSEVPLWVYARLNRSLRSRLEPFFELLAMRSLVLHLRYALAGEIPPPPILSHSLLANPLQQLVTRFEEAETLVAKLEALLVSDYPFVAGLAVTYRQQGPGGVERQLADGILRHGLIKSRNEPLKRTLRYLVDVRNCLMLSRLWRWQVKQPPPLTGGGTIDSTSLQRIWASQDDDRLTRLVERLAGQPMQSGKTVAMEQTLLQGLTRHLRRAGRDPLGLGVIIEYLWRDELAMHNQLLRKNLSEDRNALLEEVLLL